MKIQEYQKTGSVTTQNLEELNQIPSIKRMMERPVVIFECPQEIPCDSCLESCRLGSIEMKNINDLPIVDFENCVGCGLCLTKCPGLAAFMLEIIEEKGYVSMQYEFLPLPKINETVKALNRMGEEIAEGKIMFFSPPNHNDGTALLTVEIPKELVMEVRAIKTIKKK